MPFIFNDHKRDVPEGAHAPFSASTYAWTNYKSNEQFLNTRRAQYAATIGTHLHKLACDLISTRTRVNKIYLRIEIPFYLRIHGIPRWVSNVKDDTVENLLNYITDGIGYDMTTEQPLKYSRLFFGTADAIYFNQEKRILRIHDLKTGEKPVCIRQLEVYAALFFLEYGPVYGFSPDDIDVELRIYQGGKIHKGKPKPEDIYRIMDQIVDVTAYFDEIEGRT